MLANQLHCFRLAAALLHQPCTSSHCSRPWLTVAPSPSPQPCISTVASLSPNIPRISATASTFLYPSYQRRCLPFQQVHKMHHSLSHYCLRSSHWHHRLGASHQLLRQPSLSCIIATPCTASSVTALDVRAYDSLPVPQCHVLLLLVLQFSSMLLILPPPPALTTASSRRATIPATASCLLSWHSLHPTFLALP